MLTRGIQILLIWSGAAILLAASLPWLGLAPSTAHWLTVGLLGGTLVLLTLAAAGVRRQLAALRGRARDMLRAVNTGSGAGPDIGSAAPADPSPDGGPALESLALTLDALDQRVSRQARELLKKTRNLESLLDTIDEPVIVTDRDDKVLLCNAPAERSFGAAGWGGAVTGRDAHGDDERRDGASRTRRLLGCSIRDFVTSDRVLALHEGARSGEPQRGIAKMITPAGPRVFGVTAAPLPSAWGEGVFGVVLTLRDITELAQAGAMRTEFVANASHELRTPVAAIRAAVETIEDTGTGDPALLARLLTMIGAHSRRLEDMTRDLMDLSRLESPDVPLRVEPIDWSEIELTLRETFESALKARGLTLRFEIAADLDPAPKPDGAPAAASKPGPGGAAPNAGADRTELAPESPAFESDPRLLLLILRNLVDNATKYARDETDIRVRALRAGDKVRIEVQDAGIGIPLEHQERVFERFYQVDAARSGAGAAPRGLIARPRRGTGLGLSIVKHAVKALGGTVGLESVWGKGTTVWALIPARDPGSGEPDDA
ncbi:MAG: sensor histidine kinase [Phycisphaerales bacterium]